MSASDGGGNRGATWQELTPSGRVSRWRIGAAALILYLLLMLALGWFWSREPALFDVPSNAAARAGDRVHLAGVATVTTHLEVVDTLLHKRGGYLSNDRFPPGVWLDNMPNWEYGVLIQVRDMSKALRESFSRSQSQSREDEDLARAEPRFNFDNDSWIMPATEREYRAGLGYVEQFLQRLIDEDASDARFYARADNLIYWLRTVESRLGSLSMRLGASVETVRVNLDSIDDERLESSPDSEGYVYVKTPWLEIDDVFYEARGTTWALIHYLKAVEVDFAEVLRRKNAMASLRQIIRELEATQATVFSPVILNGSGFGLLANHSLVMASYISRANAAIIDLRELLAQG